MIEHDLTALFDKYAVSESWITARQINVPAVRGVRREWTVRVPRDLALATLIYDVNAIAQDYDGSTFAVEDLRLGEVAIHLSRSRHVEQTIILKRSADVKRKTGKIAIMIDGIVDAPEGEWEQFLAMPEPVSCVMEASRDSRKLYAQLIEARKEIILHVHFRARKESESKFELSEDLGDKTISSRIKNIVREFPDCAGFFVTSERILGNAVSLVRAELLPTRWIEIPTDEIQYIDRGTAFNQLSSRMNDMAAISVKNGHAVGVLELRENSTSFLQSELMRLRKRGFEFVPCARLLAQQPQQKDPK